MRSRSYLVAAALGTLVLSIPRASLAGGRGTGQRDEDDDDEEDSFKGDGPEADTQAVFSLDKLIEVAVRLSPDLMRSKADRQAARGAAGAARANQQWVMQMGAQYQSQGFGGQVEVGPFQVVKTDTLAGSVALGRNLPTGGNIQAQVQVAHVDTEYNIPDQVQPGASSGSSAAQTGRIQDVYSKVQTQTKVTLTQPLVRGFGPDIALADEKRADYQATAATLQTQLDAEKMVHDVVVAYWELAYANYEVEIRGQALKLAQEQENLTKLEYRAGQTSPTQVGAVTYEIASRSDALLTAQLNLEAKSLDVRKTAGLGLGRREIILRPGDAFEIGDEEWDVEDVLQKSRHGNRRLAVYALQKKAADIDVDVAKNAMLPKVDLSLEGALTGYGDTTGESVSAISGKEGYEVMAGLSVQFELSGAAKANHSAALARRRKIDIDRADAERQIDAAVVTAVKKVQSAKTRVALAEKGIQVAEENAKAEKLAFASGQKSTTNFDVMNRQTQLVEAQLRRGRAVADYHEAVAELQFLSGMILEQYRVNVRAKSRQLVTSDGGEGN